MDFSVSIDTQFKKYPGKHYDHQQGQKQFVATHFIKNWPNFGLFLMMWVPSDNAVIHNVNWNCTLVNDW